MVATPVPLLKHSRLLWIAGQTGVVAFAVFVYFRVRGLTESTPGVAIAHARDIVALEKRLGINVEAALQTPVADSGTLTTLANWVYIWGHWPVIAIVMVWTAWHHRHVFLRLRDAMVVSGFLGMAIFVAYPVAPPRLAEAAMVDTVTERSLAYRVLQPPAFVNQYAAMPSLHAGWDLLVGVAIVSAATTATLKVIGYLMPVLMAVSVVVTANHYLLDVVAGVSLVLIGHAAARWIDRRRVLRESDGAPDPPAWGGPPPAATPREGRAR